MGSIYIVLSRKGRVAPVIIYFDARQPGVRAFKPSTRGGNNGCVNGGNWRHTEGAIGVFYRRRGVIGGGSKWMRERRVCMRRCQGKGIANIRMW